MSDYRVSDNRLFKISLKLISGINVLVDTHTVRIRIVLKPI